MKEVKKPKTITQTAKEILDLFYKECSEKIPYGNLIRIEFKNHLISYEASASSSYDKDLFNELMKICDNNEVLLFNALNFLFDKNFIKGINGQTLDWDYNISIDSLTSNGVSLIEGYNLGIKQNKAKFMLIFNIKEANLVKEFSIIKTPLTIFGNLFKYIGSLFNLNKGEKMSDTQDKPKNDEIPSQESPQDTSDQNHRVVVDNNGEKYIRAEEETE